jgi:hypothetical protein
MKYTELKKLLGGTDPDYKTKCEKLNNVDSIDKNYKNIDDYPKEKLYCIKELITDNNILIKNLIDNYLSIEINAKTNNEDEKILKSILKAMKQQVKNSKYPKYFIYILDTVWYYYLDVDRPVCNNFNDFKDQVVKVLTSIK